MSSNTVRIVKKQIQRKCRKRIRSCLLNSTTKTVIGAISIEDSLDISYFLTGLIIALVQGLFG